MIWCASRIRVRSISEADMRRIFSRSNGVALAFALLIMLWPDDTRVTEAGQGGRYSVIAPSDYPLPRVVFRGASRRTPRAPPMAEKRMIPTEVVAAFIRV